MAQEFKTINSLLTLDKTFDRANGQPLDNTTIWYSLERAQDYAKGPKAYVGQIISVVINNNATMYQIINTQWDLKEIGEKMTWGTFVEEE